MADMNEYEEEQVAEIERWKSEEPGVVGKAFGVVIQLSHGWSSSLYLKLPSAAPWTSPTPRVPG